MHLYFAYCQTWYALNWLGYICNYRYIHLTQYLLSCVYKQLGKQYEHEPCSLNEQSRLYYLFIANFDMKAFEHCTCGRVVTLCNHFRPISDSYICPLKLWYLFQSHRGKNGFVPPKEIIVTNDQCVQHLIGLYVCILLQSYLTISPLVSTTMRKTCLIS